MAAGALGITGAVYIVLAGGGARAIAGGARSMDLDKKADVESLPASRQIHATSSFSGELDP
jgi:hypothetical protein